MRYLHLGLQHSSGRCERRAANTLRQPISLADTYAWIHDHERVVERGAGRLTPRWPVAIITGSGGLIGSESVAHFVEAGLRRRRDRERHAGPVLRPRGLDRATRPNVSCAELGRLPLAGHRHPRRRGVDAALRRATRNAIELVVHTAAQPSHDWAASDPHTDFSRQRGRDAEPAEANARARPGRDLHLLLDEQGVRRPAQHLPLVELGRGSSCPRITATRRHRHTMSIDASTHSLFGVSKAAADLLVQEYGRYFGMPTVCFRGGCLTGPNHAGAQLHGFLSYLMRCTITGEPYTIFGYGGKQVRDNIHSADLVAAFAAFHARPRAGRRLQHRRRPRVATARCSRRSSSASGSPGASSTGALATRRASAITAGGSATSSRSRATIPTGSSATASKRSCARSTSKTSSMGRSRSEALGRHPRPQRGRLDRRTLGRPLGRARGDRLRARVVDDASSDGTAEIVGRLARREPGDRCVASATRAASASRSATASTLAGDAVCVMMADASDSPADLVAYVRLLRPATTAPSAPASSAAAATNYPRFKLALNRAANTFIRLVFRHGYNDTTNAFKAYRREVIETVQPLLSNHFNLTVELPLKAIVRGHSYGIVPISWTNRDERRLQARLKEMGSRYLFIVLYVFLEHHLSRGDYRRARHVPEDGHSWRAGMPSVRAHNGLVADTPSAVPGDAHTDAD